MKIQDQLLFAVILFCLPLQLFGQKAPIKWGKIPKSDLAMTSYEPDPEAEAIVLCDYGKLEFDLSSGDLKYVFQRHKRIKILTEEGVNEGDISIPYYHRENLEKVFKIDAQVIQPDGSKQSISNKDIFTEEINRSYSRKKFSVPGLQVGSVIEYRYTLESTYYFVLPDWYFQEMIPVRYSELRANIPEWYDYLILSQGLKVTKYEEDRVTSNMLVPGVRIRTTQGANSWVTSAKQSGFARVDANIIYRRYIMENAPALREESFVTSMDNHLSKLTFQLRGVQFPERQYNPVLGSWEELYKGLDEDSDFGGQINRAGKYKKAFAATKELVADAQSDQEKIQILYQYLAKNLEWNGIYSISAHSGLNQCFEQKTGTSGDLNLLLLALLRANDIKAHPMLISTRSNGYPMQLYPILEQFNHVLVVAEADGKSMIIDVHDPVYPINFPRENALNSAGWLMTNPPQWVSLTSPNAVTTLMGTFEMAPDGGATGQMQMKFAGYDAIDERMAYRQSGGKHWEKRMANFSPDAVISDMEVNNLGAINQPLGMSFNCQIPGLGQEAGDFLYLPAIAIPLLEENPLQAETREYPVEMLHPFKEKYIFNYILPEGYDIEELPEPAVVTLPNKGGKIKYVASDAGGKVQILLNVHLDQVFYTPEEYDNIRSFFNLLVEKHNEQVILKKRT